MKIDSKKLDLALARRRMVLSDLRDAVSSNTLYRLRHGDEPTPRTVGKIAQALGVDPADLLED